VGHFTIYNAPIGGIGLMVNKILKLCVYLFICPSLILFKRVYIPSLLLKANLQLSPCMHEFVVITSYKITCILLA